MLVTNSLPNSCLVNLIDMTLACEDAHSKLIEVFTVADVESCWQQFVADLEALVKILKLNLGQYFEARFGQDFNSSFSRDADVWLRF